MKSPKNWIIAALAGALALSIVTGVVAQRQGGVTVELLVWQDTTDPERHYVSARLAGGSWRTHGTVEVELDQTTDNGRWRYGKHSFDAPVVATCASGIAVPNPTENGALVLECELLLKLQDGLRLMPYWGHPVVLPAPLNWSPDEPMANWTNVTIEGTPPRVTKLSLAGLEMHGVLTSLSATLTGLAELEELHLDGNVITGSIPSNMLQLTELTHLYLDGNELEGCVPQNLKSVPNNDLADLSLPDCGPPDVLPHEDLVALEEGTNWHPQGFTFDVPPLPEGWTLYGGYLVTEPFSFLRFIVETPSGVVAAADFEVQSYRVQGANGTESIGVLYGKELRRRTQSGQLLDHILETLWDARFYHVYWAEN